MTDNNHDPYNSLFPTHEVGSMRKINATILALQNRELTPDSIEEVKYWWPKLDLGDPEVFLQLLQTPEEQHLEEWVQQVLLERLHFNIRFLESTGLDFVYTGEALRREMYEHVAKDVGGKLMEGEVLPRPIAHKIYRQILHTKRDPALLEQEQGNRFATRIFPIPAHGTTRLLLSFSQHSLPAMLTRHAHTCNCRMQNASYGNLQSADGQDDEYIDMK